MGCDIHGQIEALTDSGEWRGFVDIDRIVERAYTPFRMLFNVRNYSGRVLFDAPLFPNRGLPEDFHKEFHGESSTWYWKDSDFHSHSYFTYAELRAVNWREKHVERNVTTLWHEGERTDHYREQEVDYRLILRYRCWQLVFRIMKALSKRYGADNVRCVVWFDN